MRLIQCCINKKVGDRRTGKQNAKMILRVCSMRPFLFHVKKTGISGNEKFAHMGKNYQLQDEKEDETYWIVNNKIRFKNYDDGSMIMKKYTDKVVV